MVMSKAPPDEEEKASALVTTAFRCLSILTPVMDLLNAQMSEDESYSDRDFSTDRRMESIACSGIVSGAGL